MNLFTVAALVVSANSAIASQDEVGRTGGCQEWPRIAVVLGPDGKSYAALGFSHPYLSVGPRIDEHIEAIGRTVDLLDREPFKVVWADSISIGNHQESSQCINIGTQQGGRVGYPGWSPDGSWLAYVQKEGAEHHLWISSADGRTSRRVSEQPISLLAEGQLSPIVPAFHARVPFAWSADSERILFAPATLLAASSSDRVGEFNSVKAFDSRVTAGDTQPPPYAKAATSLLPSQIVEVEISGAQESKVLLDEPGLFHIEYWGDDSLIIGSSIRAGNSTRQEFSVRGIDSDRHLVLSASRREHIYSVQNVNGAANEAVGVVLSNDEMLCSGEPLFNAGKNICVDSTPWMIAETTRYILELELSGRLTTYEKESGAVVQGTKFQMQDSSEFVPFYSLLRGPDGKVFADQNETIIIIDGLDASGVLRSFRLSRFDPVSGESEVLLNDENNSRNVTRIGPIISSDMVLIEHAFESGRFWFSELNLITGEIRRIERALETMLTYSDFRSDDLLYERADGVPLTGRLFWPNDPKLSIRGKLPLVIWQYPKHSSSIAHYVDNIDYFRARHQSKLNDLGYVGDWLPLNLLDEGFAVLHYPSFPLIGTDNASEHGTFKDQLLKSAAAAVVGVTATGRIDNERIAIAGHSRGGGDAALLLAYSDLFKTGVAIAGGMNHMSMPHVLQYEDQPFWEVPERFIRNSASAQAPRINEPLLMIHGAADKSLARPSVSESLFRAIQSVGGEARLVLIPYMGHVPRSEREHQVVTQEVTEWLTHYLTRNTQGEREADGIELEHPTIH